MRTSKTKRKPERIAPKTGYDFDEKSLYRKAVWSPNALGRAASRIKSSKDVVLILPSAEGLEIQEVINAGIKPENIIACDDNPALLRKAVWREVYPQIRVFACDVADVPRRLKFRGLNMVAANLDLTGSIGNRTYKVVKKFCKNVKNRHGFLLAVTIVDQRGPGLDNMLLDKNYGHVEADGWSKRIYATLDAADVFDGIADVDLVAKGDYLTPSESVDKNGNLRKTTTKMAWAVIETFMDMSDSDQAVIDRHLKVAQNQMKKEAKSKATVGPAEPVNEAPQASVADLVNARSAKLAGLSIIDRLNAKPWMKRKITRRLSAR